MNIFNQIVTDFSKKARQKRALLFRNNFYLDKNTRILDLGSETGSNINSVLQGTTIRPENIFIADINPDFLKEGHELFNYKTVLLDELGSIPFADDYFDIVYCSSVIEHVTVCKNQVWEIYSGKKFKKAALERQKRFANEIKRVGKQYFVQTPYKHFIFESHSWLPFLSWVPRRILIPILKITNLFWVKKTCPDWHLLDKKEMLSLFEFAEILDEKCFGLTKSIMAIKSNKKNNFSI